MSYLYDSRVIAAERNDRCVSVDEQKMTAEYRLETDDGEEELVTLPIKFEVCETCDGRGKHVNPSIDAHGISAEEWDRDWDEESRESYRNGLYDVTCAECRGKRVVPVVSEQYLSPEQRAVLDKLRAAERDDMEFEALSRSERSMGA